MTDASSINLSLDALNTGMAHLEQTIGDLLVAFDGFNAGQAQIIQGQTITNRLLDSLVQSVASEGDVEGTAELLRAVLAAITENTKLVRAIPHQVEASVALHTTGEIIPPA